MAEDHKTRRSARLWPDFAAVIAFFGMLGMLLWRRLKRQSWIKETEPAKPVSKAVRESRPNVAFEPSDWPVGPVALIYVGVLVLLVVSPLAMILAYPHALPDVGRTLRIDPPGPRLQTNAAADLERLRDEEEKRLNTYYWSDKQKGTVHIPIDQAMKKLVASGIPDFPKEQQ